MTTHQLSFERLRLVEYFLPAEAHLPPSKVQVIAPRNLSGGPLRRRLSVGLELLRGTLRTGRRDVGEAPEIHCLRPSLIAIGRLLKARLGGTLVAYFDWAEIDGTRGRPRSPILAGCDFAVTETERDRSRTSRAFGIDEASVVSVAEMLTGPQRRFPLRGIYLHPERLAVLPYCHGRGLDIGCGHVKTHPSAIGVDIVAGGRPGVAGCERGRISAADLTASGDRLDMFGDGSLDYVVARHNLEHYLDVVATLREWRRVLRLGGVLAMVVPDESALNTIHLDPTHKHAFTPQSLLNLVDCVGGFDVRELRPCIPGWSFLAVLERRVSMSQRDA